MDVIDSSGEQHFGVEHNIFKQRLDLLGQSLNEAEPETINKSHNTTNEHEKVTSKYCLSCYGAKEGCCNSCAEVRDAYRQKV